MPMTIPPKLQAEFDAWEQASDEDMARLSAEEDLDWCDALTDCEQFSTALPHKPKPGILAPEALSVLE